MRLLRIVALLVFLTVVPFMFGFSFRNTIKENKAYVRAIYSYIVGFFLVLALYEIVELPLAWRKVSFDVSCIIFIVVSFVLCVLAVICYCLKFTNNQHKGEIIVRRPHFTCMELIYILLTIGLLCYQLYYTIFYEINQWSYDDKLYVTLPNEALYFNKAFPRQSIDIKRAFQMHLFFPAFLSKISGIHVATIIHTILPPFYLLMAYGVLYLLAHKWIEKREDRFIFMIFVQMIYIFGYYSQYSVTFRMLGPIWQGKAVLAVIVNPLYILILLYALENRYNNLYGCLFMIISVATVSLTLGGIVSSLAFVCIIVLLHLIKYRKREDLRYLLYIVWSSVIPAICGIVYMLKK